MPLVLNTPRFWIYQSSEYARVTQGICLNNSWICRNMPDYAWICLNMPEFAKICVNMPKSTLMVFTIQYPISPFVLQSLFYLFECLQETRGYSLKEHEAVFLKGKKWFFLKLAAGIISFVFCFRLNIFTLKI